MMKMKNTLWVAKSKNVKSKYNVVTQMIFVMNMGDILRLYEMF
jgi:hypothetical protein